MKKLFLTSSMLFCAGLMHAQTPDAFNYQAVARDNAGLILVNHVISLRLSIHDSSPAGSIVYSERDTATTNQFGLFTVQIGKGSVLSGTFSSINWSSADKYLQVEFDPSGGTAYTDMGTSQLISVPYAKVADRSDTANDAGHASLADNASHADNATHADNSTHADTAAVALNSYWNLNGNNINNTNPGHVYIGGAPYLDAGLVVRGNGIYNSAIAIEDATTNMHWSMSVSGNNFIVTKGSGTTFSPLVLHNTGEIELKDTAGTTNMYINKSGAVGIGTSSPASLLDVEGSLASGGNVGLLTVNNSGTGSAITAVGAGTLPGPGAALRGINSNGGAGVYGQASNAGYGIFGYNPAASGAAGNFTGNVFINQGKLGLGTSSPDGALTITNNAAGLTGPSIHTTNSNAAGIGLYCQNNSSNATAIFNNATGNGNNRAIISKFYDGGDSDIVRIDNYDGSNNGRIVLFGEQTGPRYGGYIYGSANFGAVLGDINAGTFTELVNAYHPTPITSAFVPWDDNVTSCGSSFYRWNAVYAVNGTIQTSDERLKENVQPISYGLNTLMNLKPVSYQWKDKQSRIGNGNNLGFLAQDLEKVLPEVVVHSQISQKEIDNAKKEKGIDITDKDSYGVKYSEMIPVLVKAIQEQQAEIEALKAQIEGRQK